MKEHCILFTTIFILFSRNVGKATIHQRNLQALAIEMFKVKNRVALEITSDVFKLSARSYSARNNSDFQRRNMKMVFYGSETLSFLDL